MDLFCVFSDILDVFSGRNKDIDMIPTNFLDTCLYGQTLQHGFLLLKLLQNVFEMAQNGSKTIKNIK